MSEKQGLGNRSAKISKYSLAYHSKWVPWMKRAARGHERAAQKRAWKKAAKDE